MPHNALKLIPGIDRTKTPALNEAAFSDSQLVRFVPDRTMGGLIEKLGGWARYYAYEVGSIIRALWAWSDSNSNSYLAVGAEGGTPVTVTGGSASGVYITLTFTGNQAFYVGRSIIVTGVNPSSYNGTFIVTSIGLNSVSYASTTTDAYVSGGVVYGAGGSLNVLEGGSLTEISPQVIEARMTPSFSTTTNSNEVLVTDIGVSPTSYDVVDIKTQITVGGIILYGQYQVYPVTGSPDMYKIYALNVLGEPNNAIATVSNTGAVAAFQSFANSDIVIVTLSYHGLEAGDTFPIRVATTLGGVTLFGNYVVTSVIDRDRFNISASQTAASNATGAMAGGEVVFLYHRGLDPLIGGTGYGVGPYGGGGYGSGTPPTISGGIPITVQDWTLDNWGEALIASPLGGPIYQWSPTSGNLNASAIAAAPSANQGVFVAMPQRQIVAWGSTQTGFVDPMLIRWCDVNDYNVWIAAPDNQAGSYRIPKGSRIVQCIQASQQGIVWTDVGVWAMQYVGPPYVYQFTELGIGCGLIGSKAAGALNGVVYWMGQSQFYRLAGGGVEPIRCPVWDIVFQQIDRDHVDKIRIAPNSRFGEIAWHFPTVGTGSGENYGYVKYNVLLDQWDYGFNTEENPDVSRSAWINESVLGPPIGAQNGYVYQHETSMNADGRPMRSWFETGYFALTEADNKMFVDQVWPDMKWGFANGAQSADVKLTFRYTDYAGRTPLSTREFSLNQSTTYVTPRMRGRLVSIRLESYDIDAWWRLGNIRYRFQPDGKF